MRLEVVAARVHRYRLPLREPLRTGRRVLRACEGWLLALEDAHGRAGAGEARPLAGFGGEGVRAAGEALARVARALVAAGPAELGALLDRVDALAPAAPAARAAADAALHDLFARAQGLPVAALLACAPRREIPVAALLAGEAPDALARQARAAVAAGFRTLKLKLGGRALARDLERTAAVREAAGPEVALRLDANAAWSEARALRAVRALAPLRPELLEQPVAAADVGALARVQRAAAFPIAADEALGDPQAAARIVAERAAACLVLKLPVAGGLRAALRQAERARAAGLAVYATSALDSALGVAAAAHLAAALPKDAPAAGLATGALLASDLAPALAIEAGALRLPAGPGLGVAPDPERVRRLARATACELARRC
jgi:o-succinylbenzoate synthase